jgi:hypothetical protein
MLEHKAQRPRDKNWRPNEVQPFPRTEAAVELMRRYPWVAPGHPENPTQRFYEQRAKAEAAKVEAYRQAISR